MSKIAARIAGVAILPDIDLVELLRGLHGVVYRRPLPLNWDKCVTIGSFSSLLRADQAKQSDELTAARFFEHIHPEDFSQFESALEDAIDNGGYYSVTYRLTLPGHDQLWIQDRGRTVLDENRDLLYLEGIVSDIGEYKNTADSLELYRQMLFSTRECISFIGRDYRYKAFNQAFVDSFGNTVESLLNSPVHGRTGDEIAEQILIPKLDQCFRGENIKLRYWRELPGLGKRFLDVRYDPVFSEDGSVIGAVSGVRDITEIFQSENRLKYSEERFRDFAETAADWFWESNSSDRFSFISDRHYAVTGIRPGNMINRSMVDYFISQITESNDIKQFADDVSHRKFLKLEYRLHCEDGSNRIISVSGKPIYNKLGQFVGYRGTGHDVTTYYDLSSKLNYQAKHDPLTGLINRREFEHQVQECIGTVRGSKAIHALCYLDLDQFKLVNDTCGHVAGDELLSRLSAKLQKSLGPTDTLARLGGDEFGVLFRNCTLTDAAYRASLLRQVVDSFLFQWNELNFFIGVSIGVVPIIDKNTNVTELFRRADSACYIAKDSGRNQIYVFKPEDRRQTRRAVQMEWVARIDRAITEDRFELYHQPIVRSVESIDSPSWFEFLLRMIGEDGQVIPPGNFLGAAERYDRANAIDQWVLENALGWVSKHQAEEQLYSINISGHSLNDESFLKRITELFNHHLVNPRHICFEINETAGVRNFPATSRIIDQLRDIGCRFALDDFGRGVSSFNYLKNLNIDIIKIDGNFIENIDTDPVDYATVKAINEVGKSLGKTVVAEFVSNERILRSLLELGVEFVQGNHIAVPAPLQEHR